MKPPGRFLKQDPKTKLWSDIGEKKALDKTRQALREGAPELLKDIEGGGSGVVGDRGNNNNNNKANVVDQEIPLRMSTGSALTDSLFSANTIGGMNFGSVFNSFTSAGDNNIPQQIGGGMDSLNSSMFGPGVGAEDILKAAAQIQAQQQAMQAMQQQQLQFQLQQELQQQQQQNQVIGSADQQAELNAKLQELQMLKQLQQQQNQINNLGNGLGIGNNQQRLNLQAPVSAQQNNGMVGNNNANDVHNLLAAIQGMSGVAGGGNVSAPTPTADSYAQQLQQIALLGQMNVPQGNSNNNSNNNNIHRQTMMQNQAAFQDSASTVLSGNLSEELQQLNNATAQNNAHNNRRESHNSISSQQTQQRGNINIQSQQQTGGYQDYSYNTSVASKSPQDDRPMPSMAEHPSSIPESDSRGVGNGNGGESGGGGSGLRRPGNMRGQCNDFNSSFTRAQRIGLKNSSTQHGRRPNRKAGNAELQNSLKNSMMSIESLSLDDLGDFEGAFDVKSSFLTPGTSPDGGMVKAEGGDEKGGVKHGDGPHDMSTSDISD